MVFGKRATFQVFSVISLNFSSRPDKNAASVTKESIEVRHIVLNVRVINQSASTIDQPSQNGVNHSLDLHPQGMGINFISSNRAGKLLSRGISGDPQLGPVVQESMRQRLVSLPVSLCKD